MEFVKSKDRLFSLNSARKVKYWLVDNLESVSARFREFSTPAELRKFDKIHLGSGPNHMPGWANLDIAGRSNLIWDLRKPLPLNSRNIKFVYTEHFIEHIVRDDGRKLLLNVKAALGSSGVLRISTPDLKVLVQDYLDGNLIANKEGCWFPESLCAMVNEGMRFWGHEYLYDEADLVSLLKEVGFTDIRRVEWQKSEYPELRGLETRPYFGDLILEAT